MSTLSEIKNRIAKLERVADPKGTPDSFDDAMVPALDESIDAEAFYANEGMPDNKQEAVFCFGKDANRWPKAVRQRFNV